MNRLPEMVVRVDACPQGTRLDELFSPKSAKSPFSPKLTKRDILFPIRRDDAVKNSHTSWSAHIQATRSIGNFPRWKEHDEYQKRFDKLLRDLKQELISTAPHLTES